MGAVTAPDLSTKEGQIDKNIYAEAKSMQKRVKGMNEDLQKQLEILDSFSLNEDQPG